MSTVRLKRDFEFERTPGSRIAHRAGETISLPWHVAREIVEKGIAVRVLNGVVLEDRTPAPAQPVPQAQVQPVPQVATQPQQHNQGQHNQGQHNRQK